MKIPYLLLFAGVLLGQPARWTAKLTQSWYAKQPWLVGSNYVPASAINQLEMWQAETFDPAEIDKELGWAQGLGMNTLRVFLHDQLWVQDAAGFKQRIDAFLTIADRHGIKPLFVFFDSCWDPNPKAGPQHPPIPGVHNSGWVQSPGRAGLADRANYARLEAYVGDIVRTFGKDDRVLGWDVWNEPDNGVDAERFPLVAELLPKVFAWVRATDPSQPVTSGVWHDDDWATSEKLNAVERTQLEQSDIITFHSYDWPETLERKITQ